MNSRFIRLSKDMIYRFKDDSVIALSSQLSYSLLAAFFPFLIFLLTLSPYLNVDKNTILQSLRVLVPSNAFELIKRIADEVLSNKRPHLLSLSLLFAISSSASGVKAVISGLNRAYDEPEKRPFYLVWLVSITGTIVIALTIVLSFVMLVFGEGIGDYFQCCYKLSATIRSALDILRFLISVIMLIILFAASYYVFPSRKFRVKEVIPGALISTFGWIITSIGFSYYVNNFSDYSMFYGSIGAVFVLMTWIFISSAIIIIGGEFNASLVYSRLEQEAEETKKST